MRRSGLRPAGFAALLAVVAAATAAAEEGRGPLALTVHPSGFAAVPEGLDEKLARRQRESQSLFRSICRGCGRHGSLVEADGSPFQPQRSLDAGRPR